MRCLKNVLLRGSTVHTLTNFLFNLCYQSSISRCHETKRKINHSENNNSNTESDQSDRDETQICSIKLCFSAHDTNDHRSKKKVSSIIIVTSAVKFLAFHFYWRRIFHAIFPMIDLFSSRHPHGTPCSVVWRYCELWLLPLVCFPSSHHATLFLIVAKKKEVCCVAEQLANSTNVIIFSLFTALLLIGEQIKTTRRGKENYKMNKMNNSELNRSNSDTKTTFAMKYNQMTITKSCLEENVNLKLLKLWFHVTFLLF